VALTTDDIFQIITETVGDVDPTTGDPTTATTGVIARSIELWWESYATFAASPALRMALVRKQAIRRVMAVLAQKRFDVADNLSGLSIRGNQIYQHYQEMYNCARDEVNALVVVAARTGTPTGQQNTTTFIPAPADRVDEYITDYGTAYRALNDD
jgi:hypothetical protein